MVKYTCGNCGRIFTRKDSYEAHCNRKYPCEKVEVDNPQEMLIKLAEEMANLKKENDEMKQKIAKLEESVKTVNNVNHGTINNTTNNTINLIAYGKEDIDKIDKKCIIKALTKGYGSIPCLIEQIHFNNDHKENHNVYLPSLKDTVVAKYDGKNWIFEDRKDFIEDMFTDKKEMLVDKFNSEEINNKLTKNQKDLFELFANEDEEGAKIKKVKKEIGLKLYNKRDMPKNNKSKKPKK